MEVSIVSKHIYYNDAKYMVDKTTTVTKLIGLKKREREGGGEQKNQR